MASDRPETPPPRPARYDGTEQRKRVLAAALEVFAGAGFAGASVRTIAAQAGIEQGHLTYYFPSKMALWRGVIEAFAPEPLRQLETRMPASAALDAAAAAQAILPAFLRAFADNPRVTRLMLQELSVDSERSEWLAEHVARPVWTALEPLFVRLHADGRLGGAAPETAYFAMIGAALVTFGNAGRVRQFTGRNPASRGWVDQAIAHMIQPVLARCAGEA